MIPRVALPEIATLTGGMFPRTLNITGRPIANKYREGKVKRTLKRELKELETDVKEAVRISAPDHLILGELTVTRSYLCEGLACRVSDLRLIS